MNSTELKTGAEDPPVAGLETQAVLTQLHASTPQGQELVALAERMAALIQSEAARHDREASYPYEAIDALREAGYFTAPIPEHFGGMGVASVRDLFVAQSRLARGNASVAIGVNMHFAPVANMARLWRMAVASGDADRPVSIGAALRRIAGDGTVMAAAHSEAGQDLSLPATTAVRTDDGWVVNGKKIFATMSPAADVLIVAVQFAGLDGPRYGYAQVPRTAPGVTIHEDWDALGMRGSGSNSVSFEDVRIPASAIGGGFPAGRLSQRWIEDNLSAGGFHAAASLGIAEAAVEEVLRARAKRAPSDDPFSVAKAAEMLVDLAAMRALLDRAGAIIDAFFDRHLTERPTFDAALTCFTEVQAAKSFIGQAAGRVVDAAMSLSGGSGYLNRSPLSRHYRDVRAIGFMHPLGANRSLNFLGRRMLGLDVDLA